MAIIFLLALDLIFKIQSKCKPNLKQAEAGVVPSSSLVKLS